MFLDVWLLQIGTYLTFVCFSGVDKIMVVLFLFVSTTTVDTGSLFKSSLGVVKVLREMLHILVGSQVSEVTLVSRGGGMRNPMIRGLITGHFGGVLSSFVRQQCTWTSCRGMAWNAAFHCTVLLWLPMDEGEQQQQLELCQFGFSL